MRGLCNFLLWTVLQVYHPFVFLFYPFVFIAFQLAVVISRMQSSVLGFGRRQ